MIAFRLLAAAFFVVTATASQAQHPLDAALPGGWGTATQGLFLFKHQCSSCHSEYDSYAAAANTGTCFLDPARMFNYVKQKMPPAAPGSLKDTEVYALVAYVLDMKGIIKRSDFVNAKSLQKIVMPNQGGMISSSCPKEAGGLGKGNVTKDSPKTVPALTSAGAVVPAPPPPQAAARPKPTQSKQQ